jgi:hypothetical protein
MLCLPPSQPSDIPTSSTKAPIKTATLPEITLLHFLMSSCDMSSVQIRNVVAPSEVVPEISTRRIKLILHQLNLLVLYIASVIPTSPGIDRGIRSTREYADNRPVTHCCCPCEGSASLAIYRVSLYLSGKLTILILLRPEASGPSLLSQPVPTVPAM